MGVYPFLCVLCPSLFVVFFLLGYSGLMKVGILGATGLVGRTLMRLLQGHPWFELTAIAASPKSVGERIDGHTIQACRPDLPCDLVFSTLHSSVAGPIEQEFVKAGYYVVSNARNHRMVPDVPLLVPEVNPEALGSARLITNPNCIVAPLVLALHPLREAFGIEAVSVVTLQALSGAGSRAPDLRANVLPMIEGEEEKIQTEPLKILSEPTLKISAQVNRVPVKDGHLLRVSVKFRQKPTIEQVAAVMRDYKSLPQQLQLPTAPKRPLHLFLESDAPQPLVHGDLERGMAVAVGQLRPCTLFDAKFALLSHNLIRGAAGAALLNAELIYAQK